MGNKWKKVIHYGLSKKLRHVSVKYTHNFTCALQNSAKTAQKQNSFFFKKSCSFELVSIVQWEHFLNMYFQPPKHG